MSRPLLIDTIVDISPLAPELDPTDTVPAQLQPALLGDYGAESGQARLYAILDAAQATGLVDMFETQELPHTCLYSGDAMANMGDLSPWLIELRPDDRMLRDLMTAADTADEDGPWHFWRRQIGIFLRSDLPLEELRLHFRKYTKLPDEEGDTFFLRFFEPDFLAALLGQATPGEIAGFFAPLKSVIAIEQPRPEVWAASVMSANPELDAAPTRMTLTRRKWRAMQLVEYNRHARKICVAHSIPKAEHQAFVDTAVRLQTYGFDHDTNLVDAFKVLQKVDHAHHPSIWKTIASGELSLGFILYKVRQHFGLEGIPA
ncbi:DUF4123 domain-containing protein [Litoreibacter janthinus]|uniref:DUF4123 domain-containing protein n=1 Tax=Litoreibacter janthinus TaxID=670154 RepID=A0A1I6IF17_9RHOB|nr:DUF4123 domain-containing protein [Litoreibacter janthinus]SFR65234.1 protein of unknown function [Litoreibacter janthinus]